MTRLTRFVRLHAAFLTAYFALTALPVHAAAAAALPEEVASDVDQSWRLLRTTYYRPIDDQVILDGAHDALVNEVKKRGLNITVPALHLNGSDDATEASVDDAIATIASAAHASPADIAYVAIEGMAKAVGDKYTTFFTPDQFKEFNQALDPQRISGIGVMIVPDSATSLIRLTYVIPGAPADKAGLHSGDVIATIDGVTTKGLALDAASRMLRGKAGTTVHVGVEHGTSEPEDVAVTRTQVQPPTVVFRMLPGDIGYIDVMAFGRATPEEFDTALSRVRDGGARAIVLDLRNDGGGYVDSALDIVSRFIARKPVLTVQERGVPDTTYRAEDDVMTALPVTVLVNQYTASASEITAGALQDDGVGILVGTRTFGKGVMQTLTPLPDGAAIKITTAHYLTPNKRDINLKGLDPDVHVDETQNALFGDAEKDPQLRAALDVLQKKIGAPKTALAPHP